MSPKFNNMLITGGALTFAEGDIHFNSSGQSATDRGIDRLFLNVAAGAFHDSAERFDPPKCHPNTRVAVIQEIIDWLDDPKASELVMWLHGAAGAGKSAIAQTIAQMLFEQGRLSGSFFFARESITGRGDERRLFPTLAYQLAKFFPSETRGHIARAVLSDPAIFDLTILSQVQSLLINPLRMASNAVSSSSKASPRLFIMDGLDECRDTDVQCRILQVFAAAVKSMQHHLPQKLLIASRSEIHLLAGFHERNTATLCRRLPLDNSYCPDNDIRLFLQDSFSRIKGEHRMRAYLEHSWPSNETVSSLVRKSSGQFIYASTVIKFVASPRHHPADRLKIILGLKTAGRNDRPFAALDSLYSHIFENVEDIELVLCILRMALGGSLAAAPYSDSGGVCRTFLGTSIEELELALVDLISIIRFDRATGWFTFLHASIPDFLLDPHRSKTFYVDQPKVNLYRAQCSVKVICHIYSNKPHATASFYSIAWAHLTDCTGRIVEPADKGLLYQSLSSLDMRRALDHHFSYLGRSPDGSFKHIGRLLLWSLQEDRIYTDKATSLLKLTHQFDVWFLSHLQTVSINGFDNEFGIDLMVFAMTEFDGDDTLIEHRLNILGVVENGAPILSAELVTLLFTPSASTRAELLFPWSFWVYCEQNIEYFTLLRHFFHNLKRAGKYFMSGARYANAALHCVNFLFGTRQTNSRNWDEPRWIFERETLYLAVEYAVFFLAKAAAAKDLFELLLGAVTIPKDSSEISTVILTIETNAQSRLNSRIDIIFPNGQRTPGEDSFGVPSANRMFDRMIRILLLEDESVAQWQEESVRRVATAMSDYVSTTCQPFFLN